MVFGSQTLYKQIEWSYGCACLLRNMRATPKLTAVLTQQPCSINFLNCRSTCAARSRIVKSPTRHTTFGHPATSCSLVHLHHNWVDNSLELFLLRLKFIFLDFVFVVTLELVLQLFFLQGVAHGEAVILQTVFGFNLTLILLIFCTVLLCFLHHAVNLSLRQAALFVCDGDLVGLACRLVLRGYVQDAIGVDVESHLNLGDTAWCWRDPIEMKFAEQVVVLGHGTFSFKYLNQHTRLIVGIRRERLSFLGGDCGVPFNEFGHNATSSFEAHR